MFSIWFILGLNITNCRKLMFVNNYIHFKLAVIRLQSSIMILLRAIKMSINMNVAYGSMFSLTMWVNPKCHVYH